MHTTIPPCAAAAAPQRRPGRPGAALLDGRTRLLEAALEAFSQQGFAHVSLRAIAERAQLDAALVAHHFGSKALLWQAVVEQVAERQQQRMPELHSLLQAPRPLNERLHAVVDFFVRLAAERHAVFLFISYELYTPGWRLQWLTEHLLRPCYQICAPLWQEAMDAGLLKSQHPASAHILLLGALTTALGAGPVVSQLAGHEVPKQAILHALRASLMQ